MTAILHPSGGATGTTRLARLALHRDRRQLPIWVASLVGINLLTAASVTSLYPTGADRIEFARNSATNAVAVGFNGLVSGTSEGAVITSQSLLVLLLAVALMNTFAVVRHTRQNEETGRAELVGAAVVGRRAPLNAALLVALVGNVSVGVTNGLAMMAMGLPVSGSIATGAAVAGTGIAFAAAATVAAQVAGTARGANGIAGTVVGLAFALRTLGDMASHVDESGVRVVSGWASWLSPIGWGQQIRPYDQHEWRVLALLGTFAVAAAAVAYTLTARRDLGSGMIAPRPGPARGHPVLLSPLGLAWRLQRGVIIGWAVAMVVIGAVYGAVANDVDDLFAGSDSSTDIFEDLGGGSGELEQAYLAASTTLSTAMIGATAVQMTNRLRSEETAGTLETLLATPVSRSRWMTAHLMVAVGGAAAIVTLTGAVMGLAYGISIGDTSHQTARLAGAALAQGPGILVLAGFGAALFGLVPRHAHAVAWGSYAVCLVLGQIGDLLNLPQIVLDLSPFTHLPAAPARPITVLPLVVLTAIAAVSAAVGVASFQRRDVS